MKGKFRLIVYTLLLVFVGLSGANATCYQVTGYGGDVKYTENIGLYENATNISIKKVDDGFCSQSLNHCTDINKLYPNDKATAESVCKRGINNDTKSYVCVWNDDYNFCNVDNLTYVKCGDIYDIPSQVPSIIYFVITLLKIATPIILVIVGVITLFKAMSASKEDEMKKAQSSLIKKIIYAALVFFVISIVQFAISLVAEDSDKEGFTSCFNCFLNNNCESTMYYKTVIGEETICTSIKTGEKTNCKGEILNLETDSSSDSSNSSNSSDPSPQQHHSSGSGIHF